MDPYLERSGLWMDFHNRLIVALADDLAPRLRPRYYVSIEERTYLAGLTGLTFAGRPDVAVVAAPKPAYHTATTTRPASPGVVTVELPEPDFVTETYLEVRTGDGNRVVTVVELLSPANKLPGEGRDRYEHKRMKVLSVRTHLVEIDLLRAGPPMTMRGDGRQTHYRILISRSFDRPRADLLPFDVQHPIPDFSLPLLRRGEELTVALNPLVHALYDRAGYDLRIDYRADLEPPLEGDDAAWADALLREKGLR